MCILSLDSKDGRALARYTSQICMYQKFAVRLVLPQQTLEHGVYRAAIVLPKLHIQDKHCLRRTQMEISDTIIAEPVPFAWSGPFSYLYTLPTVLPCGYGSDCSIFGLIPNGVDKHSPIIKHTISGPD
jgi:hypothetical protein